MRDKLLLLHEFLNEITNIEKKEELTRLSESYRDKLFSDFEDDMIYTLWKDVASLAKENLFLKISVDDALRSRRLAALTTDEKMELAEVERILDGNCFEYHFQPIVNAIDGEIYAYEALMRPKSDMFLLPFHILKYAELMDRLNDIERATFLNVLNIIESGKAKFKGRIVLENVHLSNVKNRPCVNLGENSDVTLVIKGENKLNKSGIRVPEGAKLALEGEGSIDIYLDTGEYYGIGNDISSKHGELIFNQSGMVAIDARGKSGICIGSGLGGTIAICQGKYVLEMTGDTGVGIGALDADSRLDISSCDLNIDASLSKGVAIGSLGCNAAIDISKSSVKLNMGGEEIAAIGTIGGDNADVLIRDASVITNIGACRCTCVGALDERTDFRTEKATFRATARGEKALPFGGFSKDIKVSLIDSDTTVKLETDVDVVKYIPKDNIEVIRGKIEFA